MADISAIFGVLMITGIAFPGLLTTWWLLFPATVQRAQARLDQTPWRCFWLGGILFAVLIIPTAVLLSLPFDPAKFFGWALIVLTLAVSSLGAAGIAAKMGQPLANKMNANPAAGFWLGAVTLELAVIFPVIGWFLIFPLTTVTALGATGFALLRWAPKPALAPVSIESSAV
jgi:hypothetical protein